MIKNEGAECKRKLNHFSFFRNRIRFFFVNHLSCQMLHAEE